MKRRVILASLVVAALAAAGTAYGVISVTADSQTITACVNNDGQLQVAPSKGCKKNEQVLTWNTEGPAGPAGPAGPQGVPGRDGRDGRDATGSSGDADGISATITATGQKSGKFADGLAIIAVSHEIVSPRDAASGLPTGRRVHKPITIRMAWGSSSPLFVNALVTNENLTKVEIAFGGGTITLTNANVSDYQLHGSTVSLSFTYQKIEWVAGTTVVEDDWETPA
jgi:type VI secretion system secreted protein Hcp